MTDPLEGPGSGPGRIADTAADRAHMQRALQLASSARYVAPPNPAVGCVIVSADGHVIGEGSTDRVGGAHAEIAALRAVAGNGAATAGATAYVTLEPCCHHGRTPPCTDSLIAAGIDRVVVAVTDPDPRVNEGGIQTLRAAGIEVLSGSAEEQAAAIAANFAFFHRVRHKRPFVRIKLASSLDGRTAMQSGESVWITGEAARRDVQFLRAESDCVLSGSGTVLHDDPTLNVRLSAEELSLACGGAGAAGNSPIVPHDSGAVRQPLRAIVDSRMRLGADARLFSTGGDVRIYTDGIKSSKNNEIESISAVKCEVIPVLGTGGSGIDLRLLMEDLALLPVNLVHVEAGATLCGALLSAGLADEIVLYLAPHLMGNQGKPQFVLPEIHNMSERIPLALKGIHQIGEDVRLTMTFPG